MSRYPQRFCAIASYSAELAYAHSREARHYYRACGHALSRDSTAVGNWLTPERGGCIAAGVRGPFTGKGYALGIIDDPYKGPEDANSAGQRQKLIEWFQSVWLTRAEPAPEGPSQRGACRGRPGCGAHPLAPGRPDRLAAGAGSGRCTAALARAQPAGHRRTQATAAGLPAHLQPGARLAPER